MYLSRGALALVYIFINVTLPAMEKGFLRQEPQEQCGEEMMAVVCEDGGLGYRGHLWPQTEGLL